mgnify:CR=1 FL=1
MKEFLVHSVFFGAAVSLIGYEAGLLLKRKFKMAIFNPLLIAILCVMAILTVGDISYDDYNQGAQYLSYLLTPATVCLAVPLYQQLNLLKKNLKAVAAGILSGVLTSILSVLGLSYLFGLSHDMYVTLLPKSITTAIGMGVSEELGGIVTITVAVIIITGVLGNMIADVVYRVFRIKEPVAKGLALGTASHAIGTAKAMEMGPVEGAMSSLAIAVAGLLTVIFRICFCRMFIREEEQMKRMIITIGRQSGSSGRKVGELLAERLSLPLYGKAELQKIAEGTDDYEEVQAFYEEEPVNSLLYAIAMSQFEQEVGRIPFQRIRELASKESCIIIGRCAGHIFREDPEAVRVFIHADPKIRVQRIMEREGLSETKAKKFLEDTDSRRASFHKYYTKQEWGLAQDYELCLDSGVLGIEGTVEVLTEYLRFRGFLGNE